MKKPRKLKNGPRKNRRALLKQKKIQRQNRRKKNLNRKSHLRMRAIRGKNPQWKSRNQSPNPVGTPTKDAGAHQPVKTLPVASLRGKPTTKPTTPAITTTGDKSQKGTSGGRSLRRLWNRGK